MSSDFRHPLLSSWSDVSSPLPIYFMCLLDRCKCKKVKPTLATYLSKNYSYGKSADNAIFSGDLAHQGT